MFYFCKIIVFVFLIGIFCFATIYTIDWVCSRNKYNFTIGFKQFLSFYEICPVKFILHNNYVAYPFYKHNHYREIQIGFGWLDTVRYIKWHNDKDKKMAIASNADLAMEFLEDMKKNINRYMDDM